MLAHKDNDTLYFITEPEALDGTLYLGTKLIAGGGEDSLISISQLSDILLTEVGDKDILTYDAFNEKWVNTSFSELIEDFVGATEQSAGISGLVPAPQKGVTNAFLRSDGEWTTISVSQNITTIQNDTNKDHSDIMAGIKGSVVDDVLIIKDLISNDKYAHAAYVYDGKKWTAMDGNYSANNVYFKDDFIFTEPVGTVTIPTSGNTTVAAAGKNVKEFLNSLFAQEQEPMISEPKVVISLNNSTATYEVGSSYTPGYTIVVESGEYSYGPDTGVVPVSCSVTDTIGNPTSNEWSKTYAPIIVSDNMVYEVSGSVTYSDGVVPNTNLGNPYPDGQILSKTVTVKSQNKVQGHRNTFSGTFSTKKDKLTSSDIRTLTASNQNLSSGSSFNISIPVGAMRVVIAYPARLRDLTSVKDVNALNADIVSSFKKELIDVEGFNGYNAISYKVYSLDYAYGASTTNTYKVVI